MKGPDGGSELLHRVRGSIDVARDVIDRSVATYAQTAAATEGRVVDQLRDAANALAVAAAALDEELRAKTLLGPAA